MQNFTVLFRAEPEGGFTAIVPMFPGCVTYGKDLQEAKTMAADAIQAYITSLQKHNEPIPYNEDTFIGTVQLTKINPSMHA